MGVQNENLSPLGIVETCLPTLVAVTLLTGLIYLAVQQDIRLSANDPQIQIAEDTSTKLAAGKTPALSINTAIVDPSSSLATFVIVYNDSGQVLASGAKISGHTPTLPSGVLDNVRKNGESEFTWEPQDKVRLATVVTHYSGANPGFVLAARSMREVEKREDHLTQEVEIAYLVTILGVFITTLLIKILKNGSSLNFLQQFPFPRK